MQPTVCSFLQAAAGAVQEAPAAAAVGGEKKKLWGGRFTGATDPLMEKFNESLPFDKRMWREDLRVPPRFRMAGSLYDFCRVCQASSVPAFNLKARMDVPSQHVAGRSSNQRKGVHEVMGLHVLFGIRGARRMQRHWQRRACSQRRRQSR